MAGSKAQICFSFDDARGDFWDAFQILKQCNLPFTLNITTGYVDGTSPAEQWPCSKKALSVAQVQEISAYPGAEIALHGDAHTRQNDAQNMAKCEEKLRQWGCLPEDNIPGFASCYSSLHEEDYLNDSWMQGHTRYLRTGFRIQSRHFVRVYSRKIGHILPLPVLFRLAYEDTIMCPGEQGRILFSLPVTGEMKFSQLKALINACIMKKGSLIFMMHSICPDLQGEDPWSYSTERFRALCTWLAQQQELGRLEVVTSMEISKQLS